jgi:uncharacterized protein (DUF1501 family)
MNRTPKKNSRRHFLQTTLGGVSTVALYSSGLLNLVNSTHVLANNSDDYKALIYIFLEGGNDANNMLVPQGESDLRARYELYRGSLALPEDSLNSITLAKPAEIYPNSSHNNFGLHSNCPDMANLFNQRELSIVCNTGNLVMPTTRQQYLDSSVSLPPQLFSHADQQKQYQSEPSNSFQYGWGGRVAELVATKNNDNSVSPLISLSGLNAFQVSKFNQINSFVFTETGIADLAFSNNVTESMFEQFFTVNNESHLMSGKYQETYNSMQQAKAVVDSAFADANNNGINYQQIFAESGAENSSIGKDLQTIVKFIAGRGSSQNQRPIFFVNMRGFDTHQNLLVEHAQLMQDLNNALLALNKALKAQGDFDNVLTFCGSEFGRTLTPNGNDETAGTDHAWGGHALLMGGMVNGGHLFGTHPDLQVGQGLDANNQRGRWIPTTPTCHVSALIAHWFGVDKNQLADIFPSFNNFDDPFASAANLQLFKEQ